MEFSHTVTTTDLIALIAVLISILSVGVHIVLFKISDDRSAESNRLASEANSTAKSANEISNNALMLAKFEHKGKVLPNLSCTYASFEFYTPKPFVYLFLFNESHGEASISKMFSFPYAEIKNLDNDEIKYPIILKFNNHFILKLNYQIDLFDLLEEQDRIKWQKATDYESEQRFLKELDEPKRMEIFKYTQSWAERAHFEIFFTDEMKNEYSVSLSYNPEIRKFVGNPVALHPDNHPLKRK